jgi:hypothetical protein
MASSRVSLALVFVLLGYAAPAGGAETSAKTCDATGKVPGNPRHALKFCHIFPDTSCCLPAQDAEIEEHYFNLLDAGDICAKESSMAKDALKLIFCAACSPRQPEYLAEDASGQKYFRICSGLAEKVDPKQFDQCGMVKVAERGAPCKGDDVVVPSQAWSDDRTLAANGIPVPTPGCGNEVTTSVNDWDYGNCTGQHKLITDETGAFPPFLDGNGYKIQIVQCKDGPTVDPARPNVATSTGLCSDVCYTGAASRAGVARAAVALAVVFATLAQIA